MSALDTLRAQHISQGKCGCCWNQVDRDHPNNSRTLCSCGQHEPCDTARLIDDALAEVEKLTAERDELRAEVEDLLKVDHQCAAVDEAWAADRAERDELRAAVERVRDVHQPVDAMNTDTGRIVKVCAGCGTDGGNWTYWPCRTIRALDGGAQ